MVDISILKGVVNMKNLKHFKAYSENRKEFKPTRASAEADICLSCPFPSCNTTTCLRFKEEMKKVKRLKYEKAGKNVNKKSIL